MEFSFVILISADHLASYTQVSVRLWYLCLRIEFFTQLRVRIETMFRSHLLWLPFQWMILSWWTGKETLLLAQGWGQSHLWFWKASIYCKGYRLVVWHVGSRGVFCSHWPRTSHQAPWSNWALFGSSFPPQMKNQKSRWWISRLARIHLAHSSKL